MKAVSHLGSLFVWFFVCAHGIAFGATQPTLSMEVSASHPASDSYVLHVKLINTSNAPVSFENEDLPWHTPNEFVLIPRGIRLDAQGSLMAPGGPTSDYMYHTHTLAPGESLEGDVRLDSMFYSLLRDVEKYGVIIEWACKSKRLTLKCREGAGGSFLIPKGGGQPEKIRKK